MSVILKKKFVSTGDYFEPKPKDTPVKLMENNYVRKKSEIPKAIKIFFLILHIIFGLDFGFGNLFKKNTAKLLKYYSTLLTLAIVVILAWPFIVLGDNAWYWLTMIQCMVNFCLLKTAKYTVYNFLSDIHVSEQITELNKEAVGVTITIYALIMVIGKSFITNSYCLFNCDKFCVMNHIYLVLYTVYYYAVNLMHQVQILVRFYIYAHVKNMERSLKQDHDVNKFIERYDNIADCQDKIRRVCDYFTLLELVINGPKLMSSSWNVLKYAKKEDNWYTTMVQWMLTVYFVVQIVIPAVIVQLIKCRTNAIRQLLNNWMLFERDPEKYAEILSVMKYLKSRSLEYRIWGIIPIDIKLPITLISICTTYLIVIVQLTHLYD